MPRKEAASLKTRTQSRRAASKEALKQMQMLLDDDPEALGQTDEGNDDEDVALVVLHPPKKKYKISHRKSADDREVLVFKSITNHNVDNNLELECWPEELTEVQQARNDKINKENIELQNHLEAILKLGGKVVYSGDFCSAIELEEHIGEKAVLPQVQPAGGKIPVQAQQNQAQNIVLNNNPTEHFQLVVDPNLGLIVGTVAGTSVAQPYQGNVQVASNLQSGTINPVRRGRPSRASMKVANRTGAPLTRVQKAAPKNLIQAVTVNQARKPTFTTERTIQRVVDMPENVQLMADTREIAFNKLQGKTFPSLVVVARPTLRVTDLNRDRDKLDAKVKAVLMQSANRFTEWLIQQGLVKAEQKCGVHSTVQLKLGMYSEVSKFPYSGGYVWISECCPKKFVSVFSGSLFEGSPNAPMVILKLLYHWACQTNVPNVIEWVKVDNLYVKGMFTWLRAVCTVALQSHLKPLGGPGVKIEVGVISLGTTSQDGNQRQVKVEVLGVLETNSRLIRLRAVEPLTDGTGNYKKRFSKILEPIIQWVHPSSIILTDLTVDKTTLHNMGFLQVVQSNSNDYGSSNRNVMEYLRRVVPRMFQNTLSLLSRQIIQQFLDELVWREWFGLTSAQAFDNLLIHLAEQTRIDDGTPLIVRLNKVACNPFKNWAMATRDAAAAKAESLKKTVLVKKNTTPKPQQTASEPKAAKSNSPDIPEQLVPLESYYYGTIPGSQNISTVSLHLKCPLCKILFTNNLKLMDHLFKHAHNVSDDVQVCRYCLTSVPNTRDLLKHISASHPTETKFENSFVCLICENQYKNPFILGKHLSRDHCPSELPYQCGTCGYRCSNHTQAINHFYNQHDNCSTIQCPFCLKSTTIYSSARNIVQNVNFFVQHLQKHQKKQFAKRCGKCNLWFIQKDVLRDHQFKMHVSQRGKSRLIPNRVPKSKVMVPKSRFDKQPGDDKEIDMKAIKINVGKNLRCKECGLNMDRMMHYPAFDRCQNLNCNYSTCCVNAMQEHNVNCKKRTDLPVEKLPFEMFCVCGFSSLDGNALAQHLAICEKKSAYPSEEEARKACTTHSMLDVLGLVRTSCSSDKVDDVIPKIEPFEDLEEGSEEMELDPSGDKLSGTA